MDNQAFVSELSKLRTSSTLLSIRGYRNEQGEISDQQIVFHMSYRNALQKSIDKLEAMTMSNELEQQAKDDLLISFRTSLEKNEEESIEERVDAYKHFYNDDGSSIRGIKLHIKSETLHIYGSVINKRIIMPTTYKKVNSRPLTVAKAKLRSLMPIGRFRQFKITPFQVDSIRVEGMELLPS